MPHEAGLGREVLSAVNVWASTVLRPMSSGWVAVLMGGEGSRSPGGGPGRGLALRSEPRVQGPEQGGV